MSKFKLAMIQLDTQEDLENTLALISELIASAASEGAELIVLPELMNRMAKSSKVDISETLEGTTMSTMKALAEKHKLWIHCGSITETNPNGLQYNTTFFLTPEGDVVAKYQKIHLFDVEIPDKVKALESAHYASGKDVVTAKTPFGQFGFAICYDLRFPELFRLLVLKGAELIFLPANFAYGTGEAHWEALIRARAIENSCYMVAVGQVGEKKLFKAYGHSMVVNPWGEVIARMGEEIGYSVVEIDMALVSKTRANLPSLKNRREDVYHLTEG